LLFSIVGLENEAINIFTPPYIRIIILFAPIYSIPLKVISIFVPWALYPVITKKS